MLRFRRLFSCCLPLSEEEYLSGFESDESRRPLLASSIFRRPEGAYYRYTMKKSRRPVYGSKKKVFSSASSAIFGGNKDAITFAPGPSTRQALGDITEAFTNIRIHDDEDDQPIVGDVSGDDQRPPKSKPIYIDPSKAPPEFLEPLATAYLEDVGKYLQIKQWEEIISNSEHTLEKIAEASYAEVYRVTETRPFGNKQTETSILKIMRLKSPEDPNSLDCEKAIEVSNVVSEFRILNDLTDLPGFVVYKAVKLVQGVPLASCVAAWDEYNRLHNGETEFPDPRACSSMALFLVIELADAGTVLEEYNITTVSEAWDIFLGTVNALARGEELCQFEHRDLHENNICVLSRKVDPMLYGASTTPEQRFGFSGIEVTLIDYGLSRTTLQNGEVMYCDLENDLDVFRGQDKHKQFDAYRRMRNYLFTDERKLHRSAWHSEGSRPPHSREWSAYIPYTNVIWLDYLLDYIKNQMIKNGIDKKELRTFNAETKELLALMSPRTKWDDGAFPTATHMMAYMLDKKWMTYAQAGWLTDQEHDENAQDSQAQPKGKENERPAPQLYESIEDEAGMEDMKSNTHRKKKSMRSYSCNTSDESEVEPVSYERNLPEAGHIFLSDSDYANKKKPKSKATFKLTGKGPAEKQATHTYFSESEIKSKGKSKLAPKANVSSSDDSSSDEFLEMKPRSKAKAKAIMPTSSRLSPPPPPPPPVSNRESNLTRALRATAISEARSLGTIAGNDKTKVPLRRSPRKIKGKN